MNYNISFQERVALAMMRLSKQSPVTSLAVAREQAQWLKKNTKTNQKKQGNSSNSPGETNSKGDNWYDSR